MELVKNQKASCNSNGIIILLSLHLPISWQETCHMKNNDNLQSAKFTLLSHAANQTVPREPKE